MGMIWNKNPEGYLVYVLLQDLDSEDMEDKGVLT